MTAEPTNAFDQVDAPERGHWHAIGDLAKGQLAALAPQVSLTGQGGVFPAPVVSVEGVVSRAA